MTAIPVRHTATVDVAWDGPANEKRLSTDAQYRQAFAWYDNSGPDPNGDGYPDNKTDYAFIHHMVAADGTVGAANQTAVASTMGVLNGGRVGDFHNQRWSDDRAGIHAHMAAHMMDAGMSVPDLAKHAHLGAVKSAGDGAIEGLAIPFGGPFGGRDLDGEFFTKSTDFCLDWFDSRPLIYDHGTDPTTKSSVVGRVTAHEITDEGVWARAQLDRNSRYRKVIEKLIEDGALGFSSGAMPHLVQTKSGEIQRWPWVELSLTPVPANPDAVVYAVKSMDLMAHLSALEGDSPESGESYADHFTRVLSEAQALIERSEERLLVRAKVGRTLSAANRDRLSTLRDRIAESVDHGRAVMADLDELLKSTDPAAESKAAEALVAAWIEQEARLQDALRN